MERQIILVLLKVLAVDTSIRLKGMLMIWFSVVAILSAIQEFYAAPRYSGSGGSTTHQLSNSTDSNNRIPQNGKFYPKQTIKVRTNPSQSASVVGEYTKGESFVYDSYIEKEGYVWLSYISYSGARRYVAWRKKNGEQYGSIDQPNSSSNSSSPSSGTHSTGNHITVQEKGTFYPNRTLNIRNKPSQSANVVGEYTKGEFFVYDSYVENEGYVWLSYISHSGARRYVAWRVKNGIKYGTIDAPSSGGTNHSTPLSSGSSYSLIPQSGKFFPNQTVAIRNKPSRHVGSVGVYRPGEFFVYDSYIKAEGVVSLAFLLNMSQRLIMMTEL